MTTLTAIFLLGIVIGYFSFQTYLNLRWLKMLDLMEKHGFYCPVILSKSVTKFWVPLERLLDEP